MKDRGFSLIELMVVATGGVVILTIAFVILTSIFKQAKRSRLTKLIDDQSAWLNFELKKNLMEARVDSLVCEGDRVTFNNKINGEQTVIRCIEGDAIASQSARTVYLTSGVRLADCQTFVSCTTGVAPVVTFDYTMEAGNNTSGRPEDFVGKSFKTSLVIRQ